MELHYVYKMYRFVNRVSQKVVPLRVYPWPREVKKSVKTEEKCTEKTAKNVLEAVKNKNK